MQKFGEKKIIKFLHVTVYSHLVNKLSCCLCWRYLSSFPKTPGNMAGSNNNSCSNHLMENALELHFSFVNFQKIHFSFHRKQVFIYENLNSLMPDKTMIFPKILKNLGVLVKTYSLGPCQPRWPCVAAATPRRDWSRTSAVYHWWCSVCPWDWATRRAAARRRAAAERFAGRSGCRRAPTTGGDRGRRRKKKIM